MILQTHFHSPASGCLHADSFVYTVVVCMAHIIFPGSTQCFVPSEAILYFIIPQFLENN